MLGLRSLISGAVRGRAALLKMQTQISPMQVQKKHAHDHGPPQPFDNLPFKISSRYAATVVFAFLFGIGLWAPFLIVWYSMAKRTL